MSQLRTHYDNLQVKETASDEVIKGAYRYLAQKWHPDKNPDNGQEAERILKIINQAYTILSDPLMRKEHDEWIKKQRESEGRPTQRPPPPPPPPPYARQQRKEEHTAPHPRMVRPWVRFWARTLDTSEEIRARNERIRISLAAKFGREPTEDEINSAKWDGMCL